MKKHHVFPWWAGYLLIAPIRKRNLDPYKLLGDYVKPGMTIVDAGCAMGFFSIPLARMTGAEGRVNCIDPQKRMLDVLVKRASKRGLSDIIDARQCSFTSLMTGDLVGRVDLALVFGVMHEVEQKMDFIREVSAVLKQGGILIFGEPHVVSKKEFDDEMSFIYEEGFVVEEKFSRGSNTIAVLKKI